MMPPQSSSRPSRKRAARPTPAGGKPLHRLAEVRQCQGVSRRTMAQRLRTDVATVKHQENPTTDLPLTTLYRWQEALGVPVAELLAESDEPLSPPVFKRARVVRMMRVALVIRRRATQRPIGRLAQILIDQLVEIMPELAEMADADAEDDEPLWEADDRPARPPLQSG